MKNTTKDIHLSERTQFINLLVGPPTGSKTDTEEQFYKDCETFDTIFNN